MEEGLFHNPVFVNHIAENAIAVIGHGQTHSEIEVPDMATRTMKKVCPRYPTIPCSVHVNSGREARGNFDFRGVPASFVCDSTGKQLEQVKGMSPQKFIDALNSAQVKIGKRPITGSMIAKMEKDLVKGDKSLAKGKFGKAFKAYKKVVDNSKNPEFLRERGTARIEGLKAKAMEAVQEAQGMSPSKAKKALKKLQKELKDMPEAKAALEQAMEAMGG